MTGDEINPYEPSENTSKSDDHDPGSEVKSQSLSLRAFAIVCVSVAVGIPTVEATIRWFDRFAHFDKDHQTSLVYRLPIFLCVLGSTLLYAYGARTLQILSFAVLCLVLSLLFAMFSPFHLGWFS